MTTRKGAGRPTEEPAGCHIDIHIASQGDVNIYNCTAPPPSAQPCPAEPPSCAVCPPGDPATGACVPVGLGAKHKQSRKRKLEKLRANNRIPSALGASFLHLSRRFLAGRTPANPMEQEVFEVFGSLSPELQGILSCAAGSFDSLPSGDRDGIFDPGLLPDVDTPLDIGVLTAAVGAEIAQRASQVIFDDPDGAEEERPGQNRFYDPGNSENFDIQFRICRVNDIRTIAYSPALGPGDYLPAELQQQCEPVQVGDDVQVNCQVLTGSCPGNILADGTCLRVPEVEAGQAVTLQGVNFINVDATVRLAAVAPGTATAEVEAHVVGDLETPLTEVVSGQTVTIRDCRVHDRMTFQVPADMASGIYTIQAAMPNTTGFTALGDPVLSNQEFIRVIPPSTARFQIACEAVNCREETSPAWLGSDELQLQVLAAPLLADGTVGLFQRLNDGKGQRFGDMDSGERRNFARVLFQQDQPIAAVAMVILGHEIDSEDAYKKQIADFNGAFADVLGKEWKFIASGLAAVGGIQALKGLGLTGAIVVGIAIVVLLLVDVFIALWAPADLIMEDYLGFTVAELDALTSANFPLPLPSTYGTPGDLQVNLSPLSRRPTEYKERREYVSDDEDSRYEIELRYNRVV